MICTTVAGMQITQVQRHVSRKVNHLILTPALIEDNIHDNAGKADVLLNHTLELHLILLLLCSTQ